MPQLIIVSAPQVQACRERYERILAQDQAEQARLQQSEEQHEAELRHLLETRLSADTPEERKQP